MTSEEKKMLEDIHSALFESPATGGDSLIVRISRVVLAYERGSWLARAALWIVPTVAAVWAGWDSILGKLKQ